MSVLEQPSLDKMTAALRDGSCGFWVQDGKIETEEMTLDIDGVLNRRFPRIAAP